MEEEKQEVEEMIGMKDVEEMIEVENMQDVEVEELARMEEVKELARVVAKMLMEEEMDLPLEKMA